MLNLDPDPDMHQSEQSDPDPHPSKNTADLAQLRKGYRIAIPIRQFRMLKILKS
jgi:hypothetical protein